MVVSRHQIDLSRLPCVLGCYSAIHVPPLPAVSLLSSLIGAARGLPGGWRRQKGRDSLHLLAVLVSLIPERALHSASCHWFLFPAPCYILEPASWHPSENPLPGHSQKFEFLPHMDLPKGSRSASTCSSRDLLPALWLSSFPLLDSHNPSSSL